METQVTTSQHVLSQVVQTGWRAANPRRRGGQAVLLAAMALVVAVVVGTAGVKECQATPILGQQLLTNGNFETGSLSSWSRQDTGTITVASAYQSPFTSGNYGAELVSQGATTNGSNTGGHLDIVQNLSETTNLGIQISADFQLVSAVEDTGAIILRMFGTQSYSPNVQLAEANTFGTLATPLVYGTWYHVVVTVSPLDTLDTVGTLNGVLALTPWDSATSSPGTTETTSFQWTNVPSNDAWNQFSVGTDFGGMPAGKSITDYVDNLSVTSVPEPAALGLMGIGGLAILLSGRRRRA